MSRKNSRVVGIELEDEMARSYGRYAHAIILDRAIPDVRDGLKPVQRRIIYAMFESGNTSEKPYRKSAKTVGEVMGNYHPHGDQSIYDALVRLAQPWKMRGPLIDGHGNFGSPDDDPPAAMRYTEARGTSLAAELTRDLKMKTVDWKPNFDEKEMEPQVLPARYPNLLVNGCSGVSTGFATEIPPHNLGEVIDATIALIDQPSIDLEGLMGHVKGPDFPTGGILMGIGGLRDAYATGRGKVIVQSRWVVERQKDGKHLIVISEVPYGTNKARMVAQMESLRADKVVHGVLDARDESDREGTRVVVELTKAANVEGVLGILLKKTDLQVSYNFNMVAIDRKSPRCLGLKGILEAYIAHQKEVITRRSQFLLDQAKHRLHVVEGLIRAVDVLDEVIATIRKSNDRSDARTNLMAAFDFSEIQADAILDLRLHRLTGLQLLQLRDEEKELTGLIAELEEILGSPSRLKSVQKKELREIRKGYADARRTTIQDEIRRFDVSVTALVKPQNVYLALTKESYIRRSSYSSFRGSGGTLADAGTKESDCVISWCASNTTHKTIVLTRSGTAFALDTHLIPEDKWGGTGSALINVVPFDKTDRVVSILECNFSKKKEEGKYLYSVSEKGMIKRTALKQYDASRSNGIIGVGLGNGDSVVEAYISDGLGDCMVMTLKGQCIRFNEEAVSASGRGARGVRAMGLDRGDRVVSALHIPLLAEGERCRRTVLVVTTDGKFKRTVLGDIPMQLRAGKGGRIIVKRKSRPHQLWGGVFLESDKDILLVSMEDGEKVVVEARSIPTGVPAGNGYAIPEVSGQILQVIREIESSEGEEPTIDDAEDTIPGTEDYSELDEISDDPDSQLPLV